ncbi:LytTR family DNA-binding domain-containing protein [uncultured Oscillibacter sp.]|uniref:LytTR family DNA-binding domain-containing protein n=1 Tax=uncultured Oscillibacter sp. TaxID=876091 RepID=UPI0025E40B29|nr:LytTR family DNA-binding domain-containing protein [uncultured Oscillibacter sp.]
MQVEVKIDENCKNPKIIIVADKMTDEIGALVQSLSASYPKVIAVFSGDEVRLLEESEFVCIDAANQKVYAETANREYILRPRLYELEEGLNKRLFVRISMNEWYTKDISKKRRIVNKLKGNSGVPLSPPSYGYRKTRRPPPPAGSWTRPPP